MQVDNKIPYLSRVSSSCALSHIQSGESVLDKVCEESIVITSAMCFFWRRIG